MFSAMLISISRAEFFELWRNFPKDDRLNELFEFIRKKWCIEEICEEAVKCIRTSISNVSKRINERWEKSTRNVKYFQRKFGDWLQGEDFVIFRGNIKYDMMVPFTSKRATGRPQQAFDDISRKSKKRRVNDLVENHSLQQLTFAAEVSMRAAGKRNAANMISDLCKSPQRVSSQMREFRQQAEKHCAQRSMTPDEALAFYIDSKQTCFSYKLMRKTAISLGHYMYPSYHSLMNSKKACLPFEYSISETSAEIPLQNALDHWVHRLALINESIFKNGTKFNLICKWGCDGSSGHSRYKQKFSSIESDDEFLFLISFVPIKIKNETCSVWKNPCCSSTRYCRPLKFVFAKESRELIEKEVCSIKHQISNLQLKCLMIDGREIIVEYTLLLTMIDGKVCNTITNTTSSQRCYICGATPKNLNDQPVKNADNTENYGFGISPLHAWIRSFECLLHISYRLNIKKWQIRSKEEKADVHLRKTKIQEKFKQKLGLVVDKPKPGYGSTNDGNTARRFFKNSAISAEITEIDQQLITNLGTILQAISSSHVIDLEKFKTFCFDTKNIYLRLYSWYFMPVTLHKIFYHSTDIIRNCIVPIGQLSEEAQEARNKDCRRFRERHSRKTSRIATNTDLLTMLIITSDPVINNYRVCHKKKNTILPLEVRNLLKLDDNRPNYSLDTTDVCSTTSTSDEEINSPSDSSS